MDGFRVMKMDDAASIGDIFCTATGMKDVIVGRHIDSMMKNRTPAVTYRLSLLVESDDRMSSKFKLKMPVWDINNETTSIIDDDNTELEALS